MMGKRILFCVGAHRAYGSEQKMLRIMKGLKDRGHEVYCITQGWSDGTFNRLLQEAGIANSSFKLGFIYISKPLWTLDTLRNYPGAIRGVKKVLKHFKPDVIYHNSYKTLLAMSPVMEKKKVLFHVGDIAPITKSNKAIFQMLDKRTNRIVAISQSVKENLQNLGVSQPIKTIYNGIEKFEITKFKESSPTWLLGVVGQLIPRKGQEDVIRAIAHLKEMFPNLKVRFYGEGDNNYKIYLDSLATDKGVADQVEFVGFENNKSIMYSGLKCVIVSSRSEALGNVAIEPMFAKIPVISSNVGGLPEIVKHELTGLLYVPGDYIELASQLTRLLTDTALYNRLVHQAARYAEETFSIQVMLDHIEATLEQYE